MKQLLEEKVKHLPKSPGVYFFKSQTEDILYIGKAKNIYKRVTSHFVKSSVAFLNFIEQINDIDFIQTKTEQDALILESQLIKKYQPKFNIDWKDDKNYFSVAIYNKDCPRVKLTHQPKDFTKQDILIGPFVDGKELKKLLADLRKIFPYCNCHHKRKISCLYHDLELCPAPFKESYDFEKYKKSLKALQAILTLYQASAKNKLRIETYDISNTSGHLAVGSMVVWYKNKIKKDQYRRFAIKTIQGQNDVASLKEILQRRLKHKDWPQPDLIILDGGRGQLKAAQNLPFLTIALSKQGRFSGYLHSPWSHYRLSLNELPPYLKNALLQMRDEAHRFAISYHKKKRLKEIQ